MKIAHIVLVDDSEADNVYHEIILRRAGFTGELQTFENADAALADLAATPRTEPCLILLDINMPGRDGWSFADAAAEMLRDNPAVIVVMLTSSGAEGDRARAASMPQIQGYMTKPLLVDRAVDLLEGRWQPT